MSQQQLAERLSKPQSTIGRWETGATEPRLDDVLAAVHACGLELTMGLANADASWVPLISEQLHRTPADRLRHLGGADRLGVLVELAARGARAIVVGDTAGALHGWPLLLPCGPVEVVVLPEDRAGMSDDGRLRVVEQPPGTLGYSDLARSAQSLEVDGEQLQVAALIDLLRIALTDTDCWAATWALALEHTLRESARHAGGDIIMSERSEEQIREQPRPA